MFAINKTQVAKYALHLVVSSTTYKFANNAIEDHTNINSDGIPAKVGSWVIGETVASSTAKYTDPIIEKVANRYQSWKDNRNADEK